jgi:osomolarity two-component system response regulator SSK1
LNNKIIEWGSIKALQMWADLRPEVVKSISSGQAVQAQNVARNLHVPEGRATPVSRSPSTARPPPDTPQTPSARAERKSPDLDSRRADSLSGVSGSDVPMAAVQEAAASTNPELIVTEPTPVAAEVDTSESRPPPLLEAALQKAAVKAAVAVPGSEEKREAEQEVKVIAEIAAAEASTEHSSTPPPASVSLDESGSSTPRCPPPSKVEDDLNPDPAPRDPAAD